MARLAVFASGDGSNFQAIAEHLGNTAHRVCCLVCDRPGAYALERARALRIPTHTVSYRGRKRSESESEILELLGPYEVDLVVLAGFMKLLTPLVVDAYPDRIINIHPSLLPKYPGTNAIVEACEAGDSEVGITIHRVDHGMDTGPIIVQKSIYRRPGESIEETERRIHDLEHATYPAVVLHMLDELEKARHRTKEEKRRAE